MKPREKFKPPSNPDDILWGWIALIVLLILWSSVGCMSLPRISKSEPKWAPAIYRYKSVGTRCTFYSPMLKHSLDCDEPLVQDMIMINANELPKLVEKFNACEVWK